ncbi:MAG: hypothetical protein V1744_05660 [Candidatus Altiarchaeota archaeon]
MKNIRRKHIKPDLSKENAIYYMADQTVSDEKLVNMPPKRVYEKLSPEELKNLLTTDLGPAINKLELKDIPRFERKVEKGEKVTQEDIAKIETSILDTPNTPVSRQRSNLLFQGGIGQDIIHSNIAIDHVDENIKEPNIGELDASLKDATHLNPGGKVTPLQEEEMVHAAGGANPKDFVESDKLPQHVKENLISEISNKIDDFKSSIGTGNINYAETDATDAIKERNLTIGAFAGVNARLDGLNINDPGRRVAALNDISSIGLKFGVQPDEMIDAAVDAARELSKKLGREVKADEVLEKSAKAIEDTERAKQDGSFETLKQFLLSLKQKTPNNVDLAKWVEGMFSDRQEPAKVV